MPEEPGVGYQSTDDETKDETSQPTRTEQEKPERTRETEIKANVEFWQSKGVAISEEEIRQAIEALPEVEGFSWYLVIPKGLKNSEIWRMIENEMRTSTYVIVDNINMPRITEETYSVAARYSQEPDEDSLGEHAQSACDHEKTQDQFMTPAERMVAELRWFEENDTHLDEDGNITLCPNSRDTNGTVPHLSFNSKEYWERLGTWVHRGRNDRLGVRRVITKDTKVEQETSTE